MKVLLVMVSTLQQWSLQQCVYQFNIVSIAIETAIRNLLTDSMDWFNGSIDLNKLILIETSSWIPAVHVSFWTMHSNFGDTQNRQSIHRKHRPRSDLLSLTVPVWLTGQELHDMLLQWPSRNEETGHSTLFVLEHNQHGVGITLGIAWTTWAQRCPSTNDNNRHIKLTPPCSRDLVNRQIV